VKWLASLLLVGSALAHASTPPAECIAASKALAVWIEQQHGQVQRNEIETSPFADDVRMACDGTPQAYQKSLAQIMQPWQPKPASNNSFSLSETTQSLLAMTFILGLGIVSSSTLQGIYQGAAGVAVLADYPE